MSLQAQDPSDKPATNSSEREAEQSPPAASGADSKEAQNPTAEDAAAEAAFKKMVEDIGWKRDEMVKIGTNAELLIPPGLQFTGPEGAKKLMKLTGNLPNPSQLGVLATPNLSWWADFSFNHDGYVKEDEKDDIDADAILKVLRESQTEANKQRRAQGLGTLSITGWAVKPYYNEESKALEYGLKIAAQGGQGGESVNYSTKILGRRGFMDVTLICSPDELDKALFELRTTLKAFSYESGEKYAEYREGDKVSNYGLAALIGGGGLAVAAKTGLLGKLAPLLAKMGKLIIIPIIAVGVGIKMLWNKLTARRSRSS